MASDRTSRIDGAVRAGDHVGRYEILAPLGAGGMGVVYRARDTQLTRQVAVKLLPPDRAADPQRQARFAREARVLASFSHPNVATLYGVEDDGTCRALVMELVEGEPLDRRMDGRALPVEDALDLARQIADALDAAHAHGIVHRDLKPANLVVTPDGVVKVLDFGLAHVVCADASGPAQPDDATVTHDGLQAGPVGGTVAYMSPEQARGHAVDKRTDIWAFGCVLYEMLAGRPAFARATTSDTIAAVLDHEPEWSALPAGTPPRVRRVLARCLEKDVRRRMRDIGDVAADLATDVPPMRPALTSSRIAPWAGVAGVLLVASVLAVRWSRPPDAAAVPVRFSLSSASGSRFAGSPAVSPDGSRIAVALVAQDNTRLLWTRALDGDAFEKIEGTEGAGPYPFWSPDNRFVGFTAGGALKRVDLVTRAVHTICTCVTGDMLGATWNRDGVIVVAPANRAGLSRVPAAGGALTALTTLDGTRNENSHRWPHFLPDGRHFLFTARSDVQANTAIYVGSIDSPERRRLVGAQSGGLYAPPGVLLFARDGTLWAQRFDAGARRVSGEPLPVMARVQQNAASAEIDASVSADGRALVYREGSNDKSSLIWFDRDGANLGSVGPELDGVVSMSMSPDAARAAVVLPDRVSGNRDIWLVDLVSGGLTRWTSHPANDWHPVWSPDGTRIAFASDRTGASAIFQRRVDGGDEEALVLANAGPTGNRFPIDWTLPDRLTFFQDDAGQEDLGGVSPWGGEPDWLVRTPFSEIGGRFTPDARWLAYVTDETGGPEVYVKAAGETATRRLSFAGGIEPRWSRRDGELLFIGGDNALMSVPAAGRAGSGAPRRLFASCLGRTVYYQSMYGIAPDGRRTLWVCPVLTQAPRTIAVAVHWNQALERTGRPR